MVKLLKSKFYKKVWEYTLLVVIAGLFITFIYGIFNTILNLKL